MADLGVVGVGLGSASLGIQLIELGSQYISDALDVPSDEKHTREFLKNMTATLGMLGKHIKNTRKVPAIPEANVNLGPQRDPHTPIDTCRSNLQKCIDVCRKNIQNLEVNLMPVPKSQEPSDGDRGQSQEPSDGDNALSQEPIDRDGARSPETSFWNSSRFLKPFMKSKLR